MIGKLAAIFLLTPLLLFGLGGPSAEAAICADDAICPVHLTNTNTTEFAGIDVLVTINNTGDTTVLTVTLATGAPISNTFQGFVDFGYNNTALATITGDDATKWTRSKNGSQLDSFGNFDSAYQRSGNPFGAQTTLTFTLASLVTTFAENSTGAEFAVHAQYADGCSGWVSDGTPASTSSNTNCTGTHVAEPGVLFLVGSGLVGLVYLRQRLSRKA